MNCKWRPEIALTNEQAALIKKVLELYLRPYHDGQKARDTNYDYFKMIYDGLCALNEGAKKVFIDEATDIAKIIHELNTTANDANYAAVENYLLSQQINQ